ncbi:MAG: transglutaminase domain-containing protein [Desulfurococcaceae archaeon]
MWKLPIVLALALMLNLSSFPQVPLLALNAKQDSTYELRIIIGGNITNLGSVPVRVGNTDLLIYNYPLYGYSQEVVSAKLYYGGQLIDYRVAFINGSWMLLHEGRALDDLIEPGESASSMVEYVVKINMTARRRELANLSLGRINGWSFIPANYSSLTSPTPLWNYENPLVALAYKYLLSRGEQHTPLQYFALVIKWIKDNFAYSTRIPPRTVWEVILRKAGDCDEQSNLLITLLRARGIPAYIETGLVYIPGLTYVDSDPSGLFTYKFINGGAHGWAVAYIPPIGIVRIDLTFWSGAVNTLDDALNYIRYSAYYTYPTVVIEEVKTGDYVLESSKFLEEISSSNLKYYVYIEISEV